MNPYEVLGVREGASMEEIRAAYRDKVKKYHPDQYVDNPLKELAEEKLKEINEAYDILSKRMEATRGTSANNRGTAGSRQTGAYDTASQNQSSGYRGSYAEQFNRVREALARQDSATARQILEGIPVREAEWFFLMGHCYFQQKMYDAARRAYAQAVSMDPNNLAYRRAYQSATSAASYTDRDVVVCGNDSSRRTGCVPTCCLSALFLNCLSQMCCGNGYYGC